MENLKVKRNIQAFNGEKYSVWKFRIRALLTELNVIKVIDEEVPEEITDEWQKSERTAKSIIIEYLSDSFLGFATADKRAKDILSNLDGLYARKSLATQLALRKKLLSLKLQEGTSLITHFTIFEDLITELLAAGAKLEETDKVSHLLLTLPPTYDGVITAIETILEDNLTLAFVKTRLLDHEVKLQTEQRDTSTKVLQAVVRNSDSNKSNFEDCKRNKTYKHKYKNYSSNRKPTPNMKKSKGIYKCHHCGRKGHLKKDCYYYKSNFQNSNRDRTIQSIQLTELSRANESTGFAFMIDVNQLKQPDEGISFLLDSGASDHIVNRHDLFSSHSILKPPMKISIAKRNEFITASSKGTIHVTSTTGIPGVLEEVLYCPEAPYNLLSVRKMQQAGMTIIFNKNGVQITKGSKKLLKGKFLNNLIIVDLTVNKNPATSGVNICSSSTIYKDYKLWHNRLGHIGRSKFLELKNKQLMVDVDQIKDVTPDETLCEACIKGKQTRLPFSESKDKSHIKRPLFIIHSDVCGPITPSTIDNKNYFVIFVDEYTHYCVTYLITNKSQVFSVFKDYVSKSENHFNLKVVQLYCDNGGEYLSNEMKSFCVQKGISYHLTVPRTPNLNGVSERMNRTITEKARAMLCGAELEKQFWGEAVLTATYLINISPTKALKIHKTPYELWHNKRPMLKYLRIFGSTVYIHNKTQKSKFDEKSSKGILVGYEPNGYKVWDIETDRFIVARDVLVDEINFLDSRPRITNKRENINTHNEPYKKLVKLNKSNEIENVKLIDQSENISGRTIDQSERMTGMRTENSSLDKNDEKLLEVRRSDRIRELPKVDYREDTSQINYLTCALTISNKNPMSYKEIKERDDRAKWEEAIKEELDSLLLNNTWTLVQKPENKNIIDSKWVFTIKNDEFGNPLRYKARLVARGFNQQYLQDYNETFAPVARISSFRFIIAFANQFNLLIHHMDVKTAFLNGKLSEEIYMAVPEGVKCNNNQVCKLHKALYGLKQAARCWYETFDLALKGQGFKNSSADHCIYILDRGNITRNIYTVLYVDDLVIVTADISEMNEIKHYLMAMFRMVDLKEIKVFLGIKIERSRNAISLDQSQYLKSVLNKFNMQDCKAVSTPLPNKVNYEALNSDEKYDAPCRNLIGCLMYVTVCSRPDLSVAVNILSRYTNKNNKELWQCLKRVLRYVKGSLNLKLIYKRNEYTDTLSGYVDADWGNNETDRRSTTGYIFKLFENCTICWNTKRQTSVAASSTEAEYMGLFEAVREAIWLKSLANSIHLNLSGRPIIIYEDNNSCISIANNPANHKRSKHIDIKYHFSREQIEKKVIKLNYISTGEQLADGLTKPLPPIKFLKMRSGMGLE